MVYLLVVAALAIIFYVFLIFPTQWLKVVRVKAPTGLGIKAVQLSDIHIEHLRIGASRFRKLIEREQPDYILITGDFTQIESKLPDVERFLQQVLVPGIPAYAVFGNHDYRLDSEGRKKMIASIEGAGVKLLLNRSVKLDRFQLVGIDDFGTRHSDVQKAFREVDGSLPVVVITHDPNVIDAIPHHYDYLMAGHFHGMQFYIPFLFRFIDKGPVAKRGIIQGLHHENGRVLYISAGMGQTSPMRGCLSAARLRYMSYNAIFTALEKEYDGYGSQKTPAAAAASASASGTRQTGDTQRFAKSRSDGQIKKTVRAAES
ncbi:metallophosphoesterase [Paenibacillus protaetiae]|uniref:metallophosphoesterase n=1 Tax=Paenibacillus protaetiae TaxID=2509456 RepID=UPI0026ADD7D0